MLFTFSMAKQRFFPTFITIPFFQSYSFCVHFYEFSPKFLTYSILKVFSALPLVPSSQIYIISFLAQPDGFCRVKGQISSGLRASRINFGFDCNRFSLGEMADQTKPGHIKSSHSKTSYIQLSFRLFFLYWISANASKTWFNLWSSAVWHQ